MINPFDSKFELLYFEVHKNKFKKNNLALNKKSDNTKSYGRFAN